MSSHFYGKHFASMYTGSMVGAGFAPFSIMGYVVANQQPGRDGQFQVELNPVLLAAIFGESQKSIEEAIEYLSAPDPKSRSPEEEGRRLVRLGQFAYRVVNGAHYHAIRKEEQRREQNREAQARHRERLKAEKQAKLAGKPKMVKTAGERMEEDRGKSMDDPPLD